MKLIQLHEYLNLLDGGAEQADASEEECHEWLQYAERIWPRLEISDWQAASRSVFFIVECAASGHRLVHVNADWENCFLILITPADTVEPEAYLLFDIGAEYRELTLICPTLQLEDAVTDALIEESIRKLPGREDPFAILDAGEGTYLQTFAEEEEGFHIEHQLVSTACHYALPEMVSADVVIELFKSFAFGKKEWARNFQWHPMELEIPEDSDSG